MIIAQKTKRPTLRVAEAALRPAGDGGLSAGRIMPDGTVFAGVSPDTNRPIYAAAMDAPRIMTWDKAASYAASVFMHGHRDWRLPARNELALLHGNAAVIDGFNKSGMAAAGWYWSATPHVYGLAWARRFSDGFSDCDSKLSLLSVRLVRG